MENNKFFTWIQRLNSLLFLLLILLSIGLTSFIFIQNYSRDHSDSVKVANSKKTIEQPELLKLNTLDNICGTEDHYLRLTSRSSENTGLSSGGYDYSKPIRNLLFITGQQMNAHWLLDDNNSLIVETTQLGSDYHCEKKKTHAIYYEIIKKDTDQNGKLDKADAITVALSLPDGTGFTELVTGNMEILDYQLDGSGSLFSLLLQQGNDIVLQKYALPGFTKMTETKLNTIQQHTN